MINAHHKYPFAEGRLKGSFVQMADELLTAKGHVTRIVDIEQGQEVTKSWKTISGLIAAYQ